MGELGDATDDVEVQRLITALSASLGDLASAERAVKLYQSMIELVEHSNRRTATTRAFDCV